jgi:hypothetical protein
MSLYTQNVVSNKYHSELKEPEILGKMGNFKSKYIIFLQGKKYTRRYKSIKSKEMLKKRRKKKEAEEEKKSRKGGNDNTHI